MVSLKGIQKTHLRITYSCIHQLVYSRHRERVFGTSLIEICEIYTHTPLPSLLLHHHRVSQPLRVKHLFNSPCLFKFCYLIFDSLCMLLGRTPRWLSFQSDGRINIQMMTNEIWIYPRGFISISCKHINILPKKFDQLLHL